MTNTSPPADDPEPDAPTTGVMGPLLGCVLALAIAVLALRMITSDASTHRERPGTVPASGTALPTATARLTWLAGRPPNLSATPPRVDFADIPEAGQRLGFRVWQPTVLPDEYAPLRVSWQPDSFVTVPEQRPPGVLRTWYWKLEHGAGLLLEQGPGIAVSAEGAPDGEHGVITLPDSRVIIWVRGRLAMPEDPTTNMAAWTGNELRVGLPLNGTRSGWRLVSSVLSLEDLLRVAEGLR